MGNAAIAGINAYQANQLPPIPVDASQPVQQISASDFDTNVQDIPQTIAPVAMAPSADAQELQSQSDSVANGDTQAAAGQGTTHWPAAEDVPLISGVTIKPNGVYYGGGEPGTSNEGSLQGVVGGVDTTAQQVTTGPTLNQLSSDGSTFISELGDGATKFGLAAGALQWARGDYVTLTVNTAVGGDFASTLITQGGKAAGLQPATFGLSLETGPAAEAAVEEGVKFGAVANLKYLGTAAALVSFGASSYEAYEHPSLANAGYAGFQGGMAVAGWFLAPEVMVPIAVADLVVQNSSYQATNGKTYTGWTGVMASSADTLDQVNQDNPYMNVYNPPVF